MNPMYVYVSEYDICAGIMEAREGLGLGTRVIYSYEPFGVGTRNQNPILFRKSKYSDLEAIS